MSVYCQAPSGALCPLSWERLHGATPQEIEAGLELAAGQEAVALEVRAVVRPAGPWGVLLHT